LLLEAGACSFEAECLVRQSEDSLGPARTDTYDWKKR